jgi:hypothetical protein|tara:strand:- start:13574 stop:14110 length:537 start_codon:yes stop_codon:yes gene_type:complete
MNTFTLSISTVASQINSKILQTSRDLFDATEVTLDLTGVYCELFPNYISIDWGDGTAVLEPDIEVFRDYKTQSIFPELTGVIKPKFLDTPYKHTYYPSDYALNKSIIFKINVGYITGETTQLSAPFNIRTESYYETVGDMDLIGLDLIDTENNSSRFTFVTKQGDYIVQLDNKSYKGD